MIPDNIATSKHVLCPSVQQIPHKGHPDVFLNFPPPRVPVYSLLYCFFMQRVGVSDHCGWLVFQTGRRQVTVTSSIYSNKGNG